METMQMNNGMNECFSGQFNRKGLKKYYVGAFRYEGWEEVRTKTHIVIFDIIKQKRFELPLIHTTIEG